jgi:hypothetical protein
MWKFKITFLVECKEDNKATMKNLMFECGK